MSSAVSWRFRTKVVDPKIVEKRAAREEDADVGVNRDTAVRHM